MHGAEAGEVVVPQAEEEEVQLRRPDVELQNQVAAVAEGQAEAGGLHRRTFQFPFKLVG